MGNSGAHNRPRGRIGYRARNRIHMIAPEYAKQPAQSRFIRCQARFLIGGRNRNNDLAELSLVVCSRTASIQTWQ